MSDFKYQFYSFSTSLRSKKHERIVIFIFVQEVLFMGLSTVCIVNFFFVLLTISRLPLLY